jgi:hypothetical protein
MHRGSYSCSILWVSFRWAFVVRRLGSDGALGTGYRARRHWGRTNREIHTQGGGACDARVEVGPLHQRRLDHILASFLQSGMDGLLQDPEGGGEDTAQHSAANSTAQRALGSGQRESGVLGWTSLYVGMQRARARVVVMTSGRATQRSPRCVSNCTPQR